MSNQELAIKAAEAMEWERYPCHADMGHLHHYKITQDQADTMNLCVADLVECGQLLEDPAWGLPMIRRIKSITGSGCHINTCFGATMVESKIEPGHYARGSEADMDDPNHDLLAFAAALVEASLALEKD